MTELTVKDPEIVQAEIVEYMGSILEQAQQLALDVKDDGSANRAAEIGVAVKTRLVWLKKKRFTDYEEHLFPAAERIRLSFDNPIKLGIAIEKTLGAAVNKYKLDKKREEDRLRLEAEAKARVIREEASRKEREAEAERQRIIKERQEREQRARDEAEAEERRKKAEAKTREDAEIARLKKEQDERARLIKEEEDARLAKAQEAHAVGMADRVEGILENPTAIASVAKALPTKAVVEEEEKRRAEEKAAAEEAERKRQAAATEEQRLREEEAAKMKQLQDEADKAKADADLAESAAAAQATVTAADNRMRTNQKAMYEVVDKASFLKMAKAVVEGRAPIEFLGFDPEHPEKYRASAIGKMANDAKKSPDFAAKQAEMGAIGIRVWLEETGTFKAEKTEALS